MKVLLYSSHQKLIEGSGVGRAIYHQKKALEENGIEYTTNPRDDYDIVHINTVFFGSFFMSLRARLKGKKVVYHAHSTAEDFRNSFIGSNFFAPFFKLWIFICYSSADLILTPTPYSKNLLESYGIRRPIVAISNGIDLSFFERDKDARGRFRQKYGFHAHDTVIVSAGLYIERKGILDFVELARMLPQYQFVWFGYSNPHTIPRAVREAVNTNLPNLHFPGYIRREEMRDAYCGSDLFLFLTHEETEGIVLLEALAMRIPVLVRDIPIYTEWVQDGKDVYKAHSLDDFSLKIRRICSDALPCITEAGYEVAAEREISIVGKHLIEIYHNVLCEQTHRSPLLRLKKVMKQTR